MPVRTLQLGGVRSLDGGGLSQPYVLPAHHLVTHGVVTGMTGSGKTGLLLVLVEEALRAGVPVLMIDVKGDLPNLLLAFPSFDAASFVPWIDPESPTNEGRSVSELADELARQRREGLTQWGIDESALQSFQQQTALRVITPGATAAEPLHVLSSLERTSTRWKSDPEAARAALSASVSLLLRLLGRDADPARSREHVLLSVLAERRLASGSGAELPALLHDLASPPLSEVGAMALDTFLPKTERRALAAALNALLASPTFATWRQGTTLDVGAWLARQGTRTPGVIVSVAHLDDDERALVLGVLLEELLAWVRSLPGSQALRALVVMDEVYGFIPPYPANPPTKRPLVALMKQARAFGVGVVVATQNPMDLDYRALGNAGVWLTGRLQTDADRARVVDGMQGSLEHGRGAGAVLGATIKKLTARWFVLRDVHGAGEPVLFRPRHAMSWLKGPMTRAELRRVGSAGDGG
jgi:hypothetical protein